MELHRTGRIGKSWVGYIRVEQGTANRIKDYIHGKTASGTSEEAKNMNAAAQRRKKLVAEKRELQQHDVIALDKLRTQFPETNNSNNNNEPVPKAPVKTPKAPLKPTLNNKGTKKSSYVPPFRRKK